MLEDEVLQRAASPSAGVPPSEKEELAEVEGAEPPRNLNASAAPELVLTFGLAAQDEDAEEEGLQAGRKGPLQVSETQRDPQDAR